MNVSGTPVEFCPPVCGPSPPLLFAPLAASLGIFNWGIVALLIPYLLRKHGVPVDRIAEVSAVVAIPQVWFFLWSPVVDLGFRRRTWILLSTALTAICVLVAVLESAGSLPLLTELLFAASVIQSVGLSSVGAVMAGLSPLRRGRASGWFQAGSVGIGSLAGGAAIWLADRVGLPALAIVCAAGCFLPGLAALRIVEIPHARLQPGPLFSALFRDVRTLWSWRTAAGLLYFVSPVGAGAVGNLISGLGPDFHASASDVAWVTGGGGGLLMVLGALCGGVICDRVHRPTAYAIAGLLAGLSGLWLGFGPATPFTYGGGYLAYSFSTGFAFTAFTALVLEVLGPRQRGAATGYSLLWSMGYLPVAYMTWLDGIGYRHGGTRGLMALDAGGNLGAGLLLLLLGGYSRRLWREPTPVSASARQQVSS